MTERAEPDKIERLAAELARKTDAELLAAAGHERLDEIARLALIRRMRDEPAHIERLVAMLLRPRPEPAVRGLRRLAVTVRAIIAIDATDPRDEQSDSAPPLPSEQIESTLARLGPHLVDRALDPTSACHSKLAGELLLEAARADGRLWASAWPALITALNTDGDRAAWLAAHAETLPGYEDTPAFWSNFVRHNDPRSRVLAIERLARWVTIPRVREILLSSLHDWGEDMFHSPSFAAGLALRRHPRTDAFDPVLDELCDIAASQAQFPAASAALALHADEADPRALLDALHASHGFMRGLGGELREILAELYEQPEGRRWIRTHWPEAAPDAVDALVVNLDQPRPEARDPGGPIPPTRRSREQLAVILAPVFAPPERWTALPHDLQRRILGPMCEPNRDESLPLPDPLREVLRELVAELSGTGDQPTRPPHDWPEPAQLALGCAALHDAELARSLLAAWPHVRRRPHAPIYFPGLAVEPLIVAGDDRAAAVYAEWLPYAPVDFSLRMPRREALMHPIVAAAARKRVREMWAYATEGRTQDGRFSRLAPIALGRGLRAFAPVWVADGAEDADGAMRAIRVGMLARAAGTRVDDSGRGEWLDAALMAWSQSELPERLANMLVDRLLDFSGGFGNAYLDLRLDAIERVGLVPRVRGALRELAANGPHPFRAAALLADSEPLRAYRWSRQAAELWARHSWPSLSDASGQAWAPGVLTGRERWRRLTGHAPKEWARSALDSLERSAAANLDLIDIVLEHELPKPLLDALAAAIRSWERAALPWHFELGPKGSRRVGDIALQILYDHKLPAAGTRPPKQ